MRTTRRPRPSRRPDADSRGAAPMALAAAEILQTRLGLLLMARNRTAQLASAPAGAAPHWTRLAADPLLRRVLDARPAAELRTVTDMQAADVVRDRSVANERTMARFEALERRTWVMSAVSEVLEASPEAVAAGASELLSRLGCLLVPALADFVRIDMLREDGTLEAGAVVHNGPARSDGWMPDGAPVLAQRVARDGGVVMLDGGAVPAGFGAFGCLPLRARGRTLGVMTLGTTGAGLDTDDVRLAQDVARATAVALDNARLLVQAQAASRCREQALAAVSHEMRGPLQVISIASGALLRAWPADASLSPERRQIAVIADSADRMRRLMVDLLDLSRMDAGNFTVSPEPVRAGVLMHGAAEVYRPMAEQKGITLSVSGTHALVAMLDEQRVHQVLANLIANAVRHTPAGGTITLSARADDGQARFSVTDSGAGILPENLPRVFERFWTSGKCRGCAGLGLAISRAIVEAHGGTMTAASQPGQGATFTFTLPLAEA